MNPKPPKGSLELLFGDALDQALGATSVPDQVGDRAETKAQPSGELAERWEPEHLSVVSHDLAEDRDGLEAGQLHQVVGGLRVSGALEHATLAHEERVHVARAYELVRRRGRVRQAANRVHAVVRAAPGADPVCAVDGDGERGAHALGVLLNHRIDVQAPKPIPRHRHGDDPASVTVHLNDVLARHELARDYQVAFVFPVFVIDQDDHLPGPKLS